MKSYTQTLAQLKDWADLNSLTDAVSRMVFELDAAERAASRDTQAVHLARNVLLRAECRNAARNVKAEADDPRAKFALAELDRLQEIVDAEIKKLVMRGGGVRIGQVGLIKWATETVRQAEAKKPTARRAAPAPKAKAKPSSSTQRASERFAKLLTRYGLTARKGTGEVGFDVQCGCRYRARGNTFVRTRRCRTACAAPGTLSWEAVEQGIARAARR